jgi:hypothetical protein
VPAFPGFAAWKEKIENYAVTFTEALKQEKTMIIFSMFNGRHSIRPKMNANIFFCILIVRSHASQS